MLTTRSGNAPFPLARNISVSDTNQKKHSENERQTTKEQEIQENKDAMEESVNHPPPKASGEDF